MFRGYLATGRLPEGVSLVYDREPWRPSHVLSGGGMRTGGAGAGGLELQAMLSTSSPSMTHTNTLYPPR